MKRRSKSCPPDPLQVPHQVFSKKMDGYTEVRPNLKYISMRSKRSVFLRDKDHQTIINQVYSIMYERSKAAKMVNGPTVLNHVREALIDHGRRVKNGKASSDSIQHQLKKVKNCKDMHPHSLYKRKCGHQLYFLQVLAAEFEAQALIRFLERSLLEDQMIEAVITQEHDLYSLHPLAERYFNDLRMITCA